jgi:integrase
MTTPTRVGPRAVNAGPVTQGDVTSMSASKPSRRSYGSGALFEKADSAGRVSYYGKWRHNGTQVKRKIGPKRCEGSRDGLTRRAAEAELRRLIAEVKPTIAPAETVTIADVGREYLLDLDRRGGKKATHAAIETALRAHIEPFLGERAIASVSYEDVADLAALMKRKKLSPKSIHIYISTLSTVYKFAMHPRRRWATSNPCVGQDLDSVPQYDGIRYLEPEQVEALVANAWAGTEGRPSPFQAIDAAMFRTAAMTGLRLGELCALRWRDIDWTASAIRVRENYVLGEFGAPKSRRSFRSVPMADPVAAGLDRYYKASGEPGDDVLVFPDPRPRVAGEPLEKTAVLHRMRKALKAAGLDERHRFHDLRHTFGTAMAAAGVPMRTLQEWMGHRDIQTTQRYADYAPRARDAELVAAAFASSEEVAEVPNCPEVPIEVPI